MNRITLQSLLFLTFTFVLFACVTPLKFDTREIDINITPQDAVTDIEDLLGKQSLWGGVIIDSVNLQNRSQLEILAYPLDSSQKPDTDKDPQGRFLAFIDGYLETNDYAAGRLVTLLGTLQAPRIGKIGESEYTYPVMQINELHIWKKASDSSDTRIHFGIGVMLHN